jgi:replicative DNA helicase
MAAGNQRSSAKEVLVIGKGHLLPQARETEEAVLGALILDKEAYSVISGILSPEMFYVKADEAVLTGDANAFGERPD